MKLSFSLSSLLLTATLLLSPLEALASSRPQALRTTETSTLDPNQQSDSELSRRLQKTKPWSKPTTSFIDSNEAIGESPIYISSSKYVVSVNQIPDVGPTDALYSQLRLAIERYGIQSIVYSDGTFRGNSRASRVDIISIFGQGLFSGFEYLEAACPNYQFPNLGNFESIVDRMGSVQIPVGEFGRAFRTLSIDDIQNMLFFEAYAFISVATGGSTPQLANPPSRIVDVVNKGETAQVLFRNFVRPMQVALGSSPGRYPTRRDVADVYQDVNRSDRFYGDLNALENSWGLGTFSSTDESLFFNTGDDKFRPNIYVTRYQLIDITVEALEVIEDLISVKSEIEDCK